MLDARGTGTDLESSLLVGHPMSLITSAEVSTFYYNQCAVLLSRGTMANLNDVLRQLREEHKQALQHVEKLDEAISVISGLVTRNGSTAALNGSQPKRFVSAVSRRRMARAQQARWARLRKGSQAGKVASATPARRILSIAARRKIAAAQRARWARVKAARKA